MNTENVEVYALMFKTECIYIGRSSFDSNDAILRHFHHVNKKDLYYRQFNPKLYDFISNNNDINLYSLNLLGKFDKNTAFIKQKEFIIQYQTNKKCNSLGVRHKGGILCGEKTSLKINKKRTYGQHCKRIKCDQTGQKFNSISECADYYKVMTTEIKKSTDYRKRNRRCSPESIKGLSFSFY